MPPDDRIRHHGTHARLLLPPPRDGDLHASVDAIIVPTARPPACLDKALALARSLDCPVLALCSKQANAEQVAQRAAGVRGFLSADIGTPSVPPLETSTLLAGTGLQRYTDTSLKRNLGLAIAVMAGWRRVVFLDDDMDVRDPGNVLRAAALLDSFAAVGLENDGFPDNSVVCHASRAVGAEQDTFIGGGAMAVAAGPGTSFFPAVYNEDWFFLLDTDQLNPVTVAGTVTQAAFDPYEDPERAGSEEFGDCLAEGVFALLDNGGGVHDADEAYWKQFLVDRRLMITGILAGIPGLACSVAEKARMTLALRTALSRLRLITPRLCVGFLRTWQQDRVRWMEFLDDLPQVDAPEALRKLGLR